MTLASMTGFARTEGTAEGWIWTWELRSVNGRGLDVRLRLPAEVGGLESAARQAAQSAFARGNVTVNLQMEQAGGAEGYRVNTAWLNTLLDTARALAPEAEVRPDQLLSARGVIETATAAQDAGQAERRDAEVLASLEQAVTALDRSRRTEGARLAEILGALIVDIETLIARAAATEGARGGQRAARLRTVLAELLEADPPVSEERLAQELALQAARADVREELDRLKAHVAQAHELLAADEPVGRRLDFLAQEFNREANTLCSKSSDIELTRIGMDLKVAIDRMREQVQNVE
ncbi:YicC/YloC family endoribonuclease [Minwuia thermotolerans]|uniref:YicC family protein n=1 Tax=Minwuia thermotolerans TaxID=2056226 RepID=A0A2M9FZG7_9PROT|nr:YicC/YloC family endoribonuclease [Minwuia thermotolerans]PJK28850.1 YicC family protein [Minwuia thermotolerans]